MFWGILKLLERKLLKNVVKNMLESYDICQKLTLTINTLILMFVISMFIFVKRVSHQYIVSEI